MIIIRTVLSVSLLISYFVLEFFIYIYIYIPVGEKKTKNKTKTNNHNQNSCKCPTLSNMLNKVGMVLKTDLHK